MRLIIPLEGLEPPCANYRVYNDEMSDAVLFHFLDQIEIPYKIEIKDITGRRRQEESINRTDKKVFVNLSSQLKKEDVLLVTLNTML